MPAIAGPALCTYIRAHLASFCKRGKLALLRLALAGHSRVPLLQALAVPRPWVAAAAPEALRRGFQRAQRRSLAAAAAPPAAAAAMGADDKRKAEEGLEGGPAKKAAADKLAVHPKRVRELRKGAVEGSGPVIYWCVPLLNRRCC